MNDARSNDAFWKVDRADVLARLSASEHGLSEPEARARLARFGRNEIAGRRRLVFLAQLWRRATEPLVLILVVAAIISALTGDTVGFWIILVILVISVALDVFQEHRAENAAEALKHAVALRADVLRDGAVR